MEILIRKFNPDTDSGFIFSTLPKGVFHAGVSSIPNSGRDAFFARIYEYLKVILAKAEIRVASSREDPDLIIGYLILSGNQLEWVFVKKGYRNLGIASLMGRGLEIHSVNKANLTKIGLRIIKQREKEREETHGKTKEEPRHDYPQSPHN